MSFSNSSNKIPVKNIYYMLCYVWHRLDEKDEVNIAREDEKDIYNLLARILMSRLKLLIKRGFYKEYASIQENTPTIKGRIKFPESLNELTFKQAKMYCEFDELSHDVLHNQIIKTTLYELMRHQLVNEKTLGDIKKIYPYFQEIQMIRLTKRIFHQVRVHRTNQQYGFLIDICKFLFDSLLMRKDKDSLERITDFNQNTPEMAYLFEGFIRNFYKKELSNSKVGSEHIYWQASGDNLSYLPRMITDTSIETNGKKIIIDTKFYQTTLSSNLTSEKIISENLYQVFAYVSNFKSPNLEKATGILLYPKVDQELNLSYIILGHPMKIFTVDLSQKWQDIHNRLLEIVA